jgi:hypothetical protein
VRLLFTTLQFQESEFYGRVAAELVRRGHEAAHVAYSRRAASALRRQGFQTWCLPDVMAELGALSAADIEREALRIVERYDTPTLRDIYRTDWPCDGLSEAASVERTVRHFLALERVFDQWRPDALIPELGSETMRTAAHLIAKARGAGTLYLFYTPFPRPLRLYWDSLHAPVVPPEDVRPLEPAERDEVEAFIERFTAARKPIRKHRKARVTPAKLRDFARHVAVRATDDRGNEYLRPDRFVTNVARERVRAVAARPLYERPDPERRFVYFPLHVVDDYKVKRVIPHCYDQASLIERVAEALPHGHDLVLKEHPMSIGRNRLSLLRRLAHVENVRIVSPHENSHDLIQRAEAIVVISSTVGLEALFHARPVLTLGQPYYSGYGVTVDVDSFREIREAVPAVLAFEPDRERILQMLHAAMRNCHDGKPMLVDAPDLSQENVSALAATIDGALQARAYAEPQPVTLG